MLSADVFILMLLLALGVATLWCLLDLLLINPYRGASYFELVQEAKWHRDGSPANAAAREFHRRYMRG